MMPSGPQAGIPSVDALQGNPAPTIEDYLLAVSDYVRLAGALTASQKKVGQIRTSEALGRIVLAELRSMLPHLRHGRAGEARISGALRSAQADVSEIHPLDGLRLAVELKPVLLAVGRAIWNRFGDLRMFAVNVHLKFPFAVVGGVMVLPTWEDQAGARRDLRPLISRLTSRLERAGGRQTEGDPPHLLEAMSVLVFDPDSGAKIADLPPPESPLRWERFIGSMAASYQARFEPD